MPAQPWISACHPRWVSAGYRGRTERISRSARQKVERCSASMVSRRVSDYKTAAKNRRTHAACLSYR